MFTEFYSEYEAKKECLIAQLEEIQNQLQKLEERKNRKAEKVLGSKDLVQLDNIIIEKTISSRRSVNADKLHKAIQGTNLPYSDFFVESPKTVSEIDKAIKRHGITNIDVFNAKESVNIKISKID